MNDHLMMHVLDVDEDFLEVYGIPLLEGKFFSKDNIADKEAYVVNEKLVQTLNWSNGTVNKYIFRDGRHPIIGVVGDFHYNPLYMPIAPLIITNSPSNNRYRVVSIKFATSDIPGLIKTVQASWSEVNPHTPFEYRFFDDVFNDAYELVRRFRTLFSTFAILSIILALVGMLSLMSYTIEQRRKEIAIRRIQGASVSDIWRLLTQKMVIIITVGNLLIFPVTWFIVEQLLGYFAYRITMSWSVFVLTWLCSLLFALAALSVQLFRATQTNPAEVIKVE
jgi:putative ABC transport system permease protein